MSKELEDILSDVSIYFNRENFILKTFDQLIKDLGPIFPEDFNQRPEGSTMADLLIYFEPLIEHLLIKRKSEFVQLLYRIDISETLVAKILTESTPEEVTKNLTQEILNRELKKVIIRNYYSEDS